MATVELEGVTKSFGSTEVLRGIDLSIGDGEFIVLVGPSGCGKSTLLRAVAGLEDIDKGTILISGKRVNDLPPARRRIAMVFQSYALYPHMTVYENMAFGLRLSGMERGGIDAAVRDAATLLGLEPMLDRRPKALSGGQRQRVAIGRAIVRQPSVFLFDEPLSNLDAGLRVKMRYEFAKLHQRFKTTTLYVTHDQVEAMTLADRIVLLNAGSVEQFGTAQELYERPASLFVAGFMGSPKMNFFEAVVEAAGEHQATVRIGGGSVLSVAADASAARSGDRVTVGIRPEHLRLGSGGFSGTVALVESLGSVRYAYLASETSAEPLVMQLSPEQSVAQEQRLQLTASPGECHLFDSSGRAFERSDPGPGSLAA